MPSARYEVSVSLKKQDWEKLIILQRQGIKVVDIFRRGLIEETAEAQKTK